MRLPFEQFGIVILYCKNDTIVVGIKLHFVCETLNCLSNQCHCGVHVTSCHVGVVSLPSAPSSPSGRRTLFPTSVQSANDTPRLLARTHTTPTNNPPSLPPLPSTNRLDGSTRGNHQPPSRTHLPLNRACDAVSKRVSGSPSSISPCLPLSSCPSPSSSSSSLLPSSIPPSISSPLGCPPHCALTRRSFWIVHTDQLACFLKLTALRWTSSSAAAANNPNTHHLESPPLTIVTP
ncbi:hypothetical protein BDY17DRAFT_181455 [Neohortaea acidophila]|uniref:Uncharacterized protein n=1 Tax=Neohortaea acidophila TaxID=245834 RepID=A0A6A6PP45_9PEZI|nr:uncharacterized protein BDY17DRAFT_181455 [Neohortaea acidophila]KAF2481037.1 hypothetical protein BDY17DRAFT_181455 [Neohortaea acidophila]